MADLEDFRAEIGSWIDENAPQGLRGAPAGALSGIWGGKKQQLGDDQRAWLARCAERGLTAPTWPTAYGGGGLSSEQARVAAQEIAKRRLPPPLIGFGLTMIGPTLLRFGTEEQKQQHLTKITRGEIRWCQGYSEPGAGSDLASLQTKAEDRGDHFLINGSKIWTSDADQADWIFCLVRTNPEGKKQEGITFILIDMETPGVTVSPIRLISGASPFCETFFEDVPVPKANVVHEVNAGWTVAKALLGHERTMIADAFGGGGGGSRRGLVDLARHYLPDSEGPLGDAVLRDQIAQNEMDTRAFLLTVQRSKDAAKAGHQPGSESSIMKVYATELNQRRNELMIQVAGPQGVGWEGEGFEPDELTRTRDWLRSRGNSIEGGTSEVQRNVIAKRVLGLPD